MKMDRELAVLIGLLFFVQLLGGCTPSSTRDSVRKSDLVGKRWTLTQLTHNRNILPLDDSDPFSLEFRDSQIGGRTGCYNSYQAGWLLGGDGRFALSGPVSLPTTIGCLPAAKSLELSYIAVLESGHTLVLDEVQQILVISAAEGELIFHQSKD